MATGGDELVLRTGYQIEEAEEIGIKIENLKQEILLEKKKLTAARKRTYEKLKKECEEVRKQVCMEETDSLSSQTELKFISSLQDQDLKGSQFLSMPWNSTDTTRSHSENSDSYIDVKSCNNPSHRLSSISNIYESVGSATYANIRPGKYIQQATKRRSCCLYKGLFVFFVLLCTCLLLTAFFALRLQLFGSDDPATTQIKSSCIPCNMSEVKGENDKKCCGRNFTESLIEYDGEGKMAHFIAYVDSAFIKERFEPYGGVRLSPKMYIYLPEWQGVLYRNRTFFTEDAPLTLRFFKEADWMANSTAKIFDFDDKTGKFTAKHTGLYYLYAKILLFDVKRRIAIVLLHKRKNGMPRHSSGYERHSVMFRCMEETETGRYKNLKSCSMDIVFLMDQGDTIEIKSLYKYLYLDLTYGETYFGATYILTPNSK